MRISPHPAIQFAIGSVAQMVRKPLADPTRFIRAQPSPVNCMTGWFGPLHAELTRRGFLEGSFLKKHLVKPIAETERGLEFVQVIQNHLPAGRHLLEVLNQNPSKPVYFDFGPYLETKNINGSLRSFGMADLRWRGNLFESLNHPLKDRRVIIFGFNQLMTIAKDMNREKLKGMLEVGERINSFLHRLPVENFVVELYLKSPAWWLLLCRQGDVDPYKQWEEMWSLLLKSQEDVSVFPKKFEEIQKLFAKFDNVDNLSSTPRRVRDRHPAARKALQEGPRPSWSFTENSRRGVFRPTWSQWGRKNNTDQNTGGTGAA